MGHPPCAARAHFVKQTQKANRAHYFTQCKRCLTQHLLRKKAQRLANPGVPQPNLSSPKRIIGRRENFESHLRNVHNITDFESAPVPPTPREGGPFEAIRVASPHLGSSSQVEHQLQPPQPSYPIPSFTDQPTHVPPVSMNVSSGDTNGVPNHTYSPGQWLHTFERFLLEFQVALALPDYFVEHPVTKRLFCFLNPGCLAFIPSRRVMGERILNSYAHEVLELSSCKLRTKQDDTSGRVNFLSDVWQNISKMHLLNVQLSLFGVCFVAGLHEVGSYHHGIAIARQLEELMVAAFEQGWNIGSVITDNAGQCERARRILAVRWPRLHFGKCFAHDINNLVKAMLQRTSFRSTTDQAYKAVNALNASSSKWLRRAKDVVMATYALPKPLAFLTLCYTRWNSMQACFASLLRVKTALKQFATRYQNDDELPDDLHVFRDDGFWNTLTEAERAIRPLCNASFILQRNENTLADVVLCFRGILDGFIAGPYAGNLIPLVEARWADCEQPLFILALCLHPRYRDVARSLPDEGISSINSVCNFAVFYFERFFRRDSGYLRHHVGRWCQDSLYVGDQDSMKVSQFPTAADFWNHAKLKSPGPNLPDLALAILSIAANTATCERYFSVLGRIHTPTRNCLKPDKVNKAAAVSQAIRERDHREAEASTSTQQNDDDEEAGQEECGGKTGRIISPVERQFQDDEWNANLTNTRAPGSHLAFAFGRPPPSPHATPRRSQPVSDLVSSTPRHAQPGSGSIPSASSRPHSRNSSGIARRSPLVPWSSRHRRELNFASSSMDTNPGSITIESEDAVARVNPQAEEHDVQDNPSLEAPSTMTSDILTDWMGAFAHLPSPSAPEPVPEPASANDDADVGMEEVDSGATEDDRHLRAVPIPDFNDTTFPQEPRKPTGTRGLTTPLVALFSQPTTL